MRTLFVLYDGECGLCQKCREWLTRQPAFVELLFIPMQSTEVIRRFPGVEELGLGEDLLVISDEGAVYRGASAWIMCLYALVEYREWAQRLAHPALLPLARRACLLVSEQRMRLSKWFFRGDPDAMKRRLSAGPASACELDGLPAEQSTRESGTTDLVGSHPILGDPTLSKAKGNTPSS